MDEIQTQNLEIIENDRIVFFVDVNGVERLLIFRTLDYMPREKFAQLLNEWEKEYGIRYLGKVKVKENEDHVEVFKKAIKFWQRHGFEVALGLKDEVRLFVERFEIKTRMAKVKKNDGGYYNIRVVV